MHLSTRGLDNVRNMREHKQQVKICNRTQFSGTQSGFWANRRFGQTCIVNDFNALHLLYYTDMQI